MRISIWPDQERPWSEIAALVDAAESTGWDGVYVYDHFMPNGPDEHALPGPVLEAWTTLTALAVRTNRLRLGTLVLGNLYRHPPVVAKMAATLDHISGGRLVLGLGAGWQVNEHAAYGIELPPPGERIDRFEEACEVIISMLRDGITDFHGRHYDITSTPADPHPLQDPLPILIGAKGERRSMRTAARFADEWNAWTTPELFRAKSAVLDRHCDELGRDPASIVRSTQAVVMVTDQASDSPVTFDRRPVLRGTTAQLAEVMAEYAASGVDEFIVPDDAAIPLERRLEQHERLRTEVFAGVQ